MKHSFAHHFGRLSLERAERNISPRGVTFQGLVYASPLLLTACGRISDRATIHFDRHNLSHIYLFEQSGFGFSAIPCRHFRYGDGLTLKEHRAVLAYCRRRRLTPNEDLLLRILRDMRSGASDPFDEFDRRSKRTKNEPSRPREDCTDYRALMAQLGSAVRNFEVGENHV